MRKSNPKADSIRLRRQLRRSFSQAESVKTLMDEEQELWAILGARNKMQFADMSPRWTAHMKCWFPRTYSSTEQCPFDVFVHWASKQTYGFGVCKALRELAKAKLGYNEPLIAALYRDLDERHCVPQQRANEIIEQAYRLYDLYDPARPKNSGLFDLGRLI